MGRRDFSYARALSQVVCYCGSVSRAARWRAVAAAAPSGMLPSGVSRCRLPAVVCVWGVCLMGVN